jgi:hypothetical protein
LKFLMCLLVWLKLTLSYLLFKGYSWDCMSFARQEGTGIDCL